ncbi:major facilitator superfamily domain-containing protein [Suillus spraguei]|nr:major facilitator superfamily domain-containing protein [Suillus spraguei]
MSAFNDTKSGAANASSSLSNDTRDDLERRLVRKLDRRISVMVILYALSNMDRSSMSSARLAGFEKDLHLRGSQYATLLSIINVGSIVMQVPGNMILHWLERPATVIPCIMFIWGVISVLTGITRNYTQILIARLLLGFAEAPFFPGAIFLISAWYKRDELAVRATLISCGSMFSSGLGTLFTTGILTGMRGVLGQASWRWLFYIEGSMTIIVAICAMFILPNFPHNTRWLTPEERSLAISRLADDGYGRMDGPGKQTTIGGLRNALSDWKVWWITVALMINHVAMSYGMYLPTIVATLGHGMTMTLLLTTPPSLLAMICAFAFSRYSDKTEKRYIFILASHAFAAVGFTMSISGTKTVLRYASMFLMAQSTTGQMVLWAWIKNTFAREPAKRAVAIAVISGVSTLGSIVGSYVWPLSWGPTYRYSYTICFAALGVSTAMLGVIHLHLKRLNKQIERDEQDAENINDLQDPVGFRYLV